MIQHEIDLSALTPHGKARAEVIDGVLHMTVTRANPLNHCKPGIPCIHYLEVPGLFRLPLRIDIEARIDSPALFVLLGDGHVNFGDRFGNRRLDDIVSPRNKICQFFDRYPIGTFAHIALIYDIKEMQILVNGAEVYSSAREPYMKDKSFAQKDAEGFPLKISCWKRTNVCIRSIRVTEFEKSAGIVRSPIEPAPEPMPQKPNFESVIANLPDDVRAAVTDMDAWLRALKPIKFRRKIDKNGWKISYVASEQGFSYAIHVAGDAMYHTLQWYILTQGKPETWGRKADRMEETLALLEGRDPAFAARMFDNLTECVGGYGQGCLAKTPYTFGGKSVVACHGKMAFTMRLSEFDDAKRFIEAVKEVHLNDRTA